MELAAEGAEGNGNSRRKDASTREEELAAYENSNVRQREGS